VIWIKLWRGRTLCSYSPCGRDGGPELLTKLFAEIRRVRGTKALGNREGWSAALATWPKVEQLCNKSAGACSDRLIIVPDSPVGVSVRASMQVCHANVWSGNLETPMDHSVGICGSSVLPTGRSTSDYCGLNIMVNSRPVGMFSVT